MKNLIYNYIIELEKTTDLNKIPSKLSSWIKSRNNRELNIFLMNDDKNFGKDFLQRLYNIRYNINEYPKCKICGKGVSKFISYTKGYKETCSKKCTNILKYGCEHPMQSKQVQENLKQSIINKYGVDNAFKSEEIKNKIKSKNLEKYGCENPQQNLNIRQKTIKTNLKRYGTESALSSDLIREKIKKTNLERYGVETPMENEKCKNNFKLSMKEKYGVENPLQIPEIIEKVKKTNLEKYGVEFPLQSSEIRKKKLRKLNYHWVKGDEIYTRYQCQKHKLKKILGDKFNKDLSENENMTLNGYIKIYDCGNLVFRKDF